MIALSDEDIRTNDRKSSKGNQLKFYRDGIWYKADYLGYEGLAEYMISKLLAHTDLEKDEYVDYEVEQIEYNGQVFNGCKSRDFTEGWQLITLERLFKQTYGEGLNKMIWSIQDHEERLKVLTEQVERVTGIPEFGIYMSKTLTVDAMFLNEDRHTHNLAVLMNGKGQFRTAPIFDNAAGLLSDTTLEYPMDQDMYTLIDKVKPKTFCTDFVEQLDIAERLYGRRITFDFSYNDVKDIADRADFYDEAQKERAIKVIMEMRRRYQYLFN